MTDEQRKDLLKKIIRTGDVDLLCTAVMTLMSREERIPLLQGLIAVGLKERPEDPEYVEAARRWGVPA